MPDMPDSEGHREQNGKPELTRLVQTMYGSPLLSLILTFCVTYSDTKVNNSEILQTCQTGRIKKKKCAAPSKITVLRSTMQMSFLAQTVLTSIWWFSENRNMFTF